MPAEIWTTAGKSTDSVARLVSVLEIVAKQDVGTDVRTVWSRVFGVEPTMVSEILPRVAQVVILARDARATAARLSDDDDAELHTRAFDQLDQVLAQVNFDANSKQLVRPIIEILERLRFTANFVRRFGEGGSLDAELLAELQAQVEQLHEAVLASALPDDLRELLTRRLDAVRSAITEVRLRGADNLEMVLDSLAGAVARHRDTVEAEPAIWGGIGKVVDLGYKLVKMAEGILRLGAPAVKLLNASTGNDGGQAL